MSTTGQPDRDPGLQPERTTLAWRRTGLALVAGVLLVGRLGAENLGAVVLVPAVATLALAGWVVVVTLRGGRLTWSDPEDPRFARTLTDGRLPAVVTLLVAVLALGELGNALSQLLRG